MAGIDVFAMSDEEFEKTPPPDTEEEEKPVEETSEQENTEEPQETQEEGDEPAPAPETEGEASEEESKEEETETEPEQQVQQPEVDYKGFYETIMAPMKANGTTIQARSPQEVIKLMQMGANYTQKMQTLAPYRKKVQMLQNAGVLDEEKRNFAIDVAQGKPEAIRQLLKNHKIDPLDIDMSEDASPYVPSNHSVSDNEIAVQAQLDDLQSTPQGQETIKLVQSWDQASLNAVWEDPSILGAIHSNRMSGAYDVIMKEMEHQRMLGNIPENMPFLGAYKAVGDMLAQQRYMQQQQAQRVAQSLPKGTLARQTTNNEKVKAAAPSGRSKKTTGTFVDPFTLSDEEFEKQFKDYAT